MFDVDMPLCHCDLCDDYSESLRECMIELSVTCELGECYIYECVVIYDCKFYVVICKYVKSYGCMFT